MAPALKAARPHLDLFWLGAVLADWAVIVASVVLAYRFNHPLLYVLAVFIIGTRQHSLAVLGHDATHFHVSKNKRLNDLLANLFAAWPIGYSFSGYRRWHFEHHRTVGTDANPELMMYRMFGKKWAPDANPIRLFVTDLLGFGAYEVLVLWHDLMQWRPQQPVWRRLREDAGLILWPITVAGLIAATCGWQAMIAAGVMWYASTFTAFFAVYRLRCYSEHIGSEWTHRLGLPPLWRRLVYLPDNTWLHWEHHAWPSVPLRRFKHAQQELEAMVAERQTKSNLQLKGAGLAMGKGG